MTSAIAIRHIAFEDLGAFAPVLVRRGYDIAYWDAGIDDLPEVDLAAPGLLVVLSASIGAYEEDTYPLIRNELAVIERRIAGARPTIGICLGAQLANGLADRAYLMDIGRITRELARDQLLNDLTLHRDLLGGTADNVVRGDLAL